MASNSYREVDGVVTGYLKTTRVCKHPPVVRLFANTRHVFANKIDISVTGHMQIPALSHELCLQTQASVCKQPDHQAGVCKQPDHQAGVCKQTDSHRRWFANNQTVTAGGLQTTGQSPTVVCKHRSVTGVDLQTTGQPQAVICKPSPVVCGQMRTVIGGSVMPRGMSLLLAPLFANHRI